MIKQLWNMILKEHTQIWATTLDHIKISLIALVIAMIIAIPLAFLLRHHKKMAEFTLQIASIIQTIPSLAILGLLLPFVGIGTVPAIIALVLYAIMPIFQNTYAGLTGIPSNLQEAAEALALSHWKKLRKVEIPLAMPMILAGIRIALVMIIGTATLAALVGGGGLGTYIYVGINSNNNAEVLLGAILSAFLALFFSWFLLFISKSKLRAKIGTSLIAVCLLAWGGVSLYNHYQPQITGKPEKQTITIAGKMGSEPEILINMYKDLIEKNDPNTKVVLKPNFGGTTFLFRALQSNKIDIYPEFTGTVLQTLVKTNKKTGSDPKQVYAEAASDLKKQYDLEYLKPMAYQNGYALATTKEFAKKYHLSKMSDLKRVNKQIHAAFDPDFYNLKDGYPGLKKVYDLDFKSIKTTESSIRYSAIASKKVNVVDGYTTDAEIEKYHLVMLDDDKNYFPPYQGAPLMKAKFAENNPQVVKALNKLAGKITTKQMQRMNYLVNVKHEKPAKVARDFLESEGLL
ncbi:ABC transporter permease/substrate-binding protein [Lactobacillus sp. PV037]|uniref:ABC transporter permease/substrate-binding protein n=1 Tax=unclassified Lactobacillus TaxID=2620435 RepID=UPI00223EA6B7|nr:MULTISPECIES: ABC transporter permease/substrate-binding protein [unclassified Lactobacillus]QNQ82043.1 ABC transporter permease/substrate-binding protein [Lactobacillus sp. PV012]QNQ83922.1 ABC transporter permease/substrate-binding protein [Lactobacillus sp. PV037]